MKKLIQVAALSGAVALALAACGDAPDDTTSTPGAGTSDSAAPSVAASDFKGCIVSDEGGFDDKSFNQLSYEGAKAGVEEVGGTFAEVQSDAATEFQGNLQSLVSEGCNTIVSVGFALSADTVTSANENPDLHYILVDDAADNDFDGTKDAENIKPLLYDTSQAAFLAGYLSAGYSQAGKVGTFGGQPYPTVTIFMDGFKQGVEYYNKEKGTSVQVVGYEGGDKGSFTGGFAANDEAKQIAAGIIDQGVDVILPVGGPIYQSAMDAIADSGREVALIGTDADVFVTDPKTEDIILTSILKAMDLSTQQAVVGSASDDWDAEAYIGTLENEGVGIAPLHNFEGKVDPALVAEVEQLKQDIIDGKVTVTSYLNQ